MDVEPSSSQFEGEDDIPPSVNINEFLGARLTEIQALTEVIETTNDFATRKNFPRHLRRRAMSHNIKRIPNRIRWIHEACREKSNTREGPNKVPRRKWRRRPRELLKEYNRRQKKFIWLETHIWHAKRFKMVEKWGYKLPYRPCNKNYRACYRASAEHCLLQDYSYLNCIELKGDLHCIVEGLKCHSSDRTGITFDSRAVIDGQRSGRTIFYHGNRFPRGAVGEVDFLWNPSTISISTAEKEKERVIWIWAHPAFAAEIIYDLVTTFGLAQEEEEVPEGDEELVEFNGSSAVEMEKLQNRNVPFSRTPKYSNGGLRMTILKDTLNRFRLTGPLSQAVLANVMQPVDLERRSVPDWASEYHKAFPDDGRRLSAMKNQTEFWRKCKAATSPAQLPPNCVLPLTIFDPRFTMPNSRTKAQFGEDEQELIRSPLDAKDLISPLWSADIRDRVTFDKLSTAKINEMRGNKFVPGIEVEQPTDANTNIDYPALPVLLLQRPGSQQTSKRLGYNSGWDVVCPAGYGMPLWLAFIMNGARAAGIREAELLERESCSVGPIVPDSDAGAREENDRKAQLMDEHFRRPPAKRLNYIELGIPSPFKCQWDLLVRDWCEQEEFYVLRNKFILRSLQNSLENRVKVCRIDPAGSLVAVSISFPPHNGKGHLTPFAHICIPQKNDTELQGKPHAYVRNLHEHPHGDENRAKRSELRSIHQSLLRRLAKKRKVLRQAKKNGKELTTPSEPTGPTDSREIVKDHRKLQRDLWLPSNTTIKNHCSRTIIGFVTNGDFCFTEGSSSGVGYVSLDGLSYYLSVVAVGNEVLVRCTNSTLYRPARINIIV